jgi:subtilisin family serine protease
MYKTVAVMAAGASAAMIPNEYIVEMQSGASAASTYNLMQSMNIAKEDMTGDWNINNGAFVGFAFKGTANQRLMLEESNAVKSVQQNEEVFALCETSAAASWGLAAVTNSASYSAGMSKTADANGGAGVVQYVLDTGVRYSHDDFSGRASFGADFTGEGDGDGNGHGTHVAGTMGGDRFGVAPGSTLVDVKVLGRSGGGSFTGVLNGVNWAAADCVSRAAGTCVANMSLGGNGSQAALEAAIQAASDNTSNGTSFVLASGNSNSNACNFTPARAGGAGTNVISVNSYDTSNRRSSFSNFGTCTDVFAPGSSITSAWWTSDTATNTISGTSMAAPHAAGGVALVLANNPGMSSPDVKVAFLSGAVSDQIGNAGTGSPNVRMMDSC